MKECLVLVEIFLLYGSKLFSIHTTVTSDHLVLVLKIYQNGNQLVFTIIQADLI